MALINCPECGKEISDSVKQCPHCGFKLKNNSDRNFFRNFFKKYGVVVFTGIIPIALFLIGYFLLLWKTIILSYFDHMWGWNIPESRMFIEWFIAKRLLFLFLSTLILPVTIFSLSKKALQKNTTEPIQIKSIRKHRIILFLLYIVGFCALTILFCVRYSIIKEDYEEHAKESYAKWQEIKAQNQNLQPVEKKYSFVDASNVEYTLIISGKKARLEEKGGHTYYGSYGVYDTGVHEWGEIDFAEPYPSISFAYGCGRTSLCFPTSFSYVYKDIYAFEAETPNGRLHLTKIE